MKLVCRKSFSGVIITLINLYLQENLSGVCGILTESSEVLKGTTLNSHALLAQCNRLDVKGLSSSGVSIIDITLPAGRVFHKDIARQSKGILVSNNELDETPFAILTSELSFSLLVGCSTIYEPLTLEMIAKAVSTPSYSKLMLTAMPLPLLSKKVPKYELEETDELITITSEDVSPHDWAKLTQYLAGTQL